MHITGAVPLTLGRRTWRTVHWSAETDGDGDAFFCHSAAAAGHQLCHINPEIPAMTQANRIGVKPKK